MGEHIIFDPTLVTAAPGHTLGMRAQDDNGEEFIYVQAGGSIAIRRVVVITEAFQAQTVTAALGAIGDRCGVVPVAFADNEYGWVSIYGTGNIYTRASCAPNTRLYTSATAGTLDDTATSQEEIKNIYQTTAAVGSAGQRASIWTYPAFRGGV